LASDRAVYRSILFAALRGADWGNVLTKVLTNNGLKSWLIGSCAAAMLTSTPALAHDIWATVEKAGDNARAQIGYGDRDDRSLADNEKFVTLAAIGPAGTTDLRRPLKVTDRLGHSVLETRAFALAPGSIISIVYDNGFWVDVPGDTGSTNTTTLLVPQGTKPHWTVKYSKMLYGRGAFSRVHHDRLEIVPLKDPYTLTAGEKLPVRVELNGKPMPKIDVQYGDGISPIADAKTPVTPTGPDGVAMVPMERPGGAYLLVIDLNAPATDKRFADVDHLFASLSFDLTK
jgi:uncharacterized GH25 family protein